MRDKAVLATCFDKAVLNEEKKGFEGALASVLERTGSAYPGWRDRTDCRDCDGVLHSCVDPQGLCLMVAGVRSTQYPERVVVQMLRELAEKVRTSQGVDVLSESRAGSLTTSLKTTMKDLIRSYSDAAAHDKTAEVREKVDQLKGVMQDNVKRILETHVTLESLENSSSSMSTQANRFLRQSVDLRRQLQFRNLKIKVIFGVCVLSAGLYAAMPFLKL